MHVCVCVSHFAAHLKLAQHCESTLLKEKKRKDMLIMVMHGDAGQHKHVFTRWHRKTTPDTKIQVHTQRDTYPCRDARVSDMHPFLSHVLGYTALGCGVSCCASAGIRLCGGHISHRAIAEAGQLIYPFRMWTACLGAGGAEGGLETWTWAQTQTTL